MTIDEQIRRLEVMPSQVVLELYGRLVKDTPVGNPSLWAINKDKAKVYRPVGYVGGTARANWRVVETPDDEVIQSTSIPTTPQLSDNWSRLYIINNTPYIVELEYGHSSQIEAGWIRRNVDNANAIIRRLWR